MTRKCDMTVDIHFEKWSKIELIKMYIELQEHDKMWRTCESPITDRPSSMEMRTREIVSNIPEGSYRLDRSYRSSENFQAEQRNLLMSRDTLEWTRPLTG